MAGGTGSRFWPMSQDDNPKQFLDLLGMGQSMLQTTFRRFEEICPRENIFIVTGREYVKHVHEQIPGLAERQVLGEPLRRNTAPCIAYAARIIGTVNPDANIIVTPSDHAVFGDRSFASDIMKALDIARKGEWIVTLGVFPTHAVTNYGYIQFAMDDDKAKGVYKVRTFVEKPPEEMAETFIKSGEYFWNTGIYVLSLRTLCEAYRRHLPAVAENFAAVTLETPAEELDRIYSLSEAVSIDIGIMEKAGNVRGFKVSFAWSDVESWGTLYATAPHDLHGNSLVSGNVFVYDVHDTIVHLPHDTTVVLQGLDNYIVAGDKNTILICQREVENQIVKFASDVDIDRLTKVSKVKK